MTNKAYIVANEQQEREVLEKFERDGIVWVAGIEKPTEWIPSQLEGAFTAGFPYALVIDNKGRVSWSNIRNLTNHKIVYDGRKEEQMSDKYVVSQEFMNELEEWKGTLHSNDIKHKPMVQLDKLEHLPNNVLDWIAYGLVMYEESNNRLIAILRWVNGEDVFEVEKPKKWVVRSIGLTNDNEHYYVSIGEFLGLKRVINTFDLESATHFDTKEKAESWANSHQEVVEVGE